MNVLEHNAFLKEYTRALREGDAAIFAGAGISRAAGYVDWKQLLKEIAEDLDLDVDRETDLIALAQYHVNHRDGRDRINQLFIDEFLEDVRLTPSHRLIASLPVHTVWTTNYDDLLEDAFFNASKRTDVKRRKEDFATTRHRSDVTIYKMHGDKTLPADAVLTKEDYETYNAKREVFTIAFKADLAKRTFLFLGFSFTDPNVLYLLARVKQLLESNSRKHYCVLKRPKPDECLGGEYECKRFAHWLTDLRRYNIQPVLIDTYDQVPLLLAELNRRSHLRDIFISGSAADFSPLGQDKFQDLCRSLGRQLIRKGFNLISGFGMGVGDSVIFRAMQALQRNDDERIHLWPFPHEVPSGVDRHAFWQQYRERMLAEAGVCVVLAGNQKEGDRLVLADGVLEEVKLARAHGKLVVPVGATGHVARNLWNEMKAQPDDRFRDPKLAQQFDILGNEAATTEVLVGALMELIRLLDK